MRPRFRHIAMVVSGSCLLLGAQIVCAEKTTVAASKPSSPAATAKKTTTKPKAPSAAAKKAPAKSAPAPAHRLQLIEVDLSKKRAQVRVEGAARMPQSKQFIFTNERGYHYIAMNAWCSASDANKPSSWTCNLELPSGYEHSSLVSLVFRARGASWEANPEEVKAIWTKAQTTPPPAGEDKEQKD